MTFGLLGGALLSAHLTAGGVVTQKQVTAEGTAPSYHLQEILTPVWEGEIAYQESVLPVRDADNELAPISLLYPALEIIEVKSASLSTTYEEGVDYTLSDNGELIVLTSGKIPTLSYAEFHPTSNSMNIQAADGGYLCFHEGDYFHSRQIVVTYRHKADYKGYVPKGKAERFPNVLKKLSDKEDIDLLVFGDSISVGGNASGFLNVAPYMPTYPELFAKGLEAEYGVTVHIRNFSVGGQTSTWGATEIDNVLTQVNDVDLAIVAFGMNDASLDNQTYLANVTRISNTIRESYASAEVILVAPMWPNPNAVGFLGNQITFYEALEGYEQENVGVAVANVTKVHESLLQYKRYEDMTGNNVNHTNDYLTRVYAQTLLKTMQEEPVKEPETSVDDLVEEPAIDKGGCGSVIGGVALGAFAGAGAAMLIRKNKED